MNHPDTENESPGPWYDIVSAIVILLFIAGLIGGALWLRDFLLTVLSISGAAG